MKTITPILTCFYTDGYCNSQTFGAVGLELGSVSLKVY